MNKKYFVLFITLLSLSIKASEIIIVDLDTPTKSIKDKIKKNYIGVEYNALNTILNVQRTLKKENFALGLQYGGYRGKLQFDDQIHYIKDLAYYGAYGVMSFSNKHVLESGWKISLGAYMTKLGTNSFATSIKIKDEEIARGESLVGTKLILKRTWVGKYISGSIGTELGNMGPQIYWSPLNFNLGVVF